MKMMVSESTISLSDLLERWVDRPGADGGPRSEMTVHRDKWAMRLTLDHFGGDRAAGSISRREVQEWKALLEDAFPRTTTPRIVLAVLVRALEYGYNVGLVDRCVVIGMMISRRS